ncbi:MAG: hypothetical protein DME38_12420 [Verrucomicrobia bacterium]|nr:MAG: hypothetical protein DME38_12420 [Verrucomicrobiota bacterium]
MAIGRGLDKPHNAAHYRRMEIHQLRYFVAVAEEGSFSHAAEREHVSQPSLSQQIQKLEEELNQQLFDRLPRSVVLTEAGRSLLPYARQILSAIADAGLSVAALEHEVAGRLSVGAIPSIAVYVLPRLIGSFQRSYPKVTFELFEDTTDKLAQRCCRRSIGWREEKRSNGATSLRRSFCSYTKYIRSRSRSGSCSRRTT